MTTLNKQNKTNIYFSLLNNARERMTDRSFNSKLKATAWAKRQEIWNELSEEEQLKFMSEL